MRGDWRASSVAHRLTALLVLYFIAVTGIAAWGMLPSCLHGPRLVRFEMDERRAAERVAVAVVLCELRGSMRGGVAAPEGAR